MNPTLTPEPFTTELSSVPTRRLRKLAFTASIEIQASDAEFAALKDSLDQSSIDMLEAIPDPEGQIEIRTYGVKEISP